MFTKLRRKVEISQQDAYDLLELCEYFINIGEENVYDDEEHQLAYSKRLAPELRIKANLNEILPEEDES